MVCHAQKQVSMMRTLRFLFKLARRLRISLARQIRFQVNDETHLLRGWGPVMGKASETASLNIDVMLLHMMKGSDASGTDMLAHKS